MNVGAAPHYKDGSLTGVLDEDAQIDFKVHGFGLQTKFKPNRVSVLADLGQYLQAVIRPTGDINFWVNPYMMLESSRTLTNSTVSAGAVIHVNDYFRSNVK